MQDQGNDPSYRNLVGALTYSRDHTPTRSADRGLTYSRDHTPTRSADRGELQKLSVRSIACLCVPRRSKMTVALRERLSRCPGTLFAEK